MMTRLDHSIIRRLPPARLADDQGRVRYVGVEYPRIVRSKKDIIDPNCQTGQDEDACWHDPLGPFC